MRGVGLPGGPGQHRSHGRNNRATAAAYRHSPQGMQARRMYEQSPEVKAKMALRRKMKMHMAGRNGA